MQAKDSSLVPSRSGVLFVSAWSVEVRVSRRHLHIVARTGREMAEASFSKVHAPRRLVIQAHGGFATWESQRWLAGVGATFLHLDRSGEILAASFGPPGPDQAAL